MYDVIYDVMIHDISSRRFTETTNPHNNRADKRAKSWLVKFPNAKAARRALGLGRGMQGGKRRTVVCAAANDSDEEHA